VAVLAGVRLIVSVGLLRKISQEYWKVGMSSLMIELQKTKIVDVQVTDDTLTVNLADGRTVSVPVEWYPRLAHGTPQEQKNWRLIGRGAGIHWPDLDEDISLENLLLGQPSGESQKSLKRWLANRSNAA
jgi:hypothetical protein